ncbi:MAG: vitamin B12 dependent methionine synthase [Chloroflexi bacterium]|nr:vitamin B12 dependent methionine synthase [Chloroflexota bacterium]
MNPDPVILRHVAVHFDLMALRERLRVREGRDAEELEALVREATAIARPKAMYRLVFIDERGEDYIVVDGVRLTSRVLSVNVGEAQRVFAHMATCGTELDAWAHGLTDMIHQFWAEAIKEAALRSAARAASADLEARYRPGKLATMAPGSLMDWPITQQRPLFQILGDPEAAIGVRLTPSCLMVPNKSISGLRFPTETSFESCQLCPRAICENRRAPYDAELYERRYKAE